MARLCTKKQDDKEQDIEQGSEEQGEEEQAEYDQLAVLKRKTYHSRKSGNCF